MGVNWLFYWPRIVGTAAGFYGIKLWTELLETLCKEVELHVGSVQLQAILRAELDAALVTALATSGRMGEGSEDVVPTLRGELI
jgi:hypothetical protein